MFKADFESLRQYQCPQWFREARFGIWSHWGPQSVPMYGDWYARHMYVEDSPQYLYHLRHYGHPSQFGYKDLVKLWRAERFEPEMLMELYAKAGARYFVGQAMHHDHFFNYGSRLNPCNSVNIGPRRDICKLWQQAARKFGLKFGLTEHLGASYGWNAVNKGCDRKGPYAGVPYDGNLPEFRDFYLDNGDAPREIEGAPWYQSPPAWREYWLRVIREVIDEFHPDLLYSDGGLPFGLLHEAPDSDPAYRYGLEMLAHYYNDSIRLHGSNQAVYNQKDRRPEIYRIGVLDIEKSQLPGIMEEVWQTDSCIGRWFYDVREVFKTAEQVVEMLIDIAAKNGNLLLNILQKPDGTIDAETRFLLDRLATWRPILDEAIHGSTPWKVFGEGESRVVIDGFREDKVDWRESDFRFTCKGDTVYAFPMKAPSNRVAVLKSFDRETIESVKLLGCGDVPFAHDFGVLTVRLPEELPTSLTNCLAIRIRR